MSNGAGADLVREGDVLAGKYRVERVLGEGGMGVVVAAWHLRLARRVAIKFLLPQKDEKGCVVPRSEEQLARFTREAQSVANMRSEHVAHVFDVGMLDSGDPFIEMEFLEGRDLAARLHHSGRLSAEEAVDLVLQACEGIAEAHSLGIVHRDLKPANLFVVARPDGSPLVKVLDFGISKATVPGVPAMDMTRTRGAMGTPLYMSPEQMESAKSVDLRSDIWALGVILYELLAGSPPFYSEYFPELVIKVTTARVRPLREFLPETPAGLEAVVDRCLEKAPDRRYASVAAFAGALEPFGSAWARDSVQRIRGIARRSSSGAPQETLEVAGPAPQIASGRAQSSSLSPVSSGSAARGAGTDPAWGRTAGASPGKGRALALSLAVLAVGGVGAALFVSSRGESGAPLPSAAASGPAPAKAEPPPGAVDPPAAVLSTPLQRAEGREEPPPIAVIPVPVPPTTPVVGPDPAAAAAVPAVRKLTPKASRAPLATAAPPSSPSTPPKVTESPPLVTSASDPPPPKPRSTVFDDRK